MVHIAYKDSKDMRLKGLNIDKPTVKDAVLYFSEIKPECDIIYAKNLDEESFNRYAPERLIQYKSSKT